MKRRPDHRRLSRLMNAPLEPIGRRGEAGDLDDLFADPAPAEPTEASERHDPADAERGD